MLIVAYYFHWDRKTIRTMPSKERRDWAKRIIAHTNRMNGGDEEDEE